MSSSADQLLDEVLRVLNYDQFTDRQLRVKLFEANLQVKTLKEELVESKHSIKVVERSNDLLNNEIDAIKQELHESGDRVDMLEDVIDKKQQLIESQGYTPSLLVRKYNSASLIEGSGLYCGGTAYVESDILSLESKLERARRDFDELDIENTNLQEKIVHLELEIEASQIKTDTYPTDYQVQQDLKIKELISNNDEMKKDFDHLTVQATKQEKHIDKQNSIMSELNREVDILREIVVQKDTIISKQKEIIFQKDGAIEDLEVNNIGKEVEIGRLNKLVYEKEVLIAKKEDVIITKDDIIEEKEATLSLQDKIIDYYSSFV